MDFAVLIVVTAGLLSIFTFIGVTWKLMRFIFKVDAALPTLLNIAHQFENNKGTTIKDKIERIEAQGDAAIKQGEVAVKVAESAKLVAATNAKIVEELTATQTTELLHFREYLHENMHKINNSLGITNMQANIADKRSARLEHRLDELMPFVVRHREDDPDEQPAIDAEVVDEDLH